MIKNLTDEQCYKKAIEVWGINAQLNMLNEECAELIVSINHHRRGRTDINPVIEELVDAELMIEEIKTSIDPELYNLWRDTKMKKFRKQLGKASRKTNIMISERG